MASMMQYLAEQAPADQVGVALLVGCWMAEQVPADEVRLERMQCPAEQVGVALAMMGRWTAALGLILVHRGLEQKDQ